MRSLLSPVALIVCAVLLAGVEPAAAQRRSGAPGAMKGRPPGGRPPKDRPLERLQGMTPEQRRRALERVPPQRRREIERKLNDFERLSPEDRARFDRFREMPAARQESVRRAFSSLNELKPERQQAVRRELRRLRSLPDGDRQSRLESAEFQNRFDEREREIIGQLSDLVPE